MENIRTNESEKQYQGLEKDIDQAFSLDRENSLWVGFLKDKLNLSRQEKLPDSIALFVKAYESLEKDEDFVELRKASEEAKIFIEALEKAESGNFESLTKRDFLALKLIPVDEIALAITELNAKNNAQKNTSSIKGLGNITIEDSEKIIQKVKNEYENKKESLQEQAEYEQSIIDQYKNEYENKLAFLNSINLPESYTKERLIGVIEDAKMMAEKNLSFTKRKVA